MSKTVAIIQSSYIPWKGFFDIIQSVDEYIVYDDVQFTKRDWRSRNLIKTPSGLQWLTIPVKNKGKYFQNIDQVEVVDSVWCMKHWRAIEHNYSKAPFYHLYRDPLKESYGYLENFISLSEINVYLIQQLCKLLNISTTITHSRDYGFAELTKTDRLVKICIAAAADCYISGPSAQSYIETEKFSNNGIKLTYADYQNYSQYPQMHGKFEHYVSVIDVLFNTGPRALDFIKQLPVECR